MSEDEVATLRERMVGMWAFRDDLTTAPPPACCVTAA